MTLKLAIIIAGVFLFLIICVFIGAIWGLPKLEKWLRERYSNDYTKLAIHVQSGSQWRWEYGKIAWETPLAITYIVGKGDNAYEVTMPDSEGFEYDSDGYRLGRLKAGGCIAYSETKEPTDFPAQSFNAHIETEVKIRVAKSISAGHGLDAKLLAMVIFGIVALVAIVMGILAMSGTFKKPQQINIYTNNTTANYTGNQTPVITGTVVK